MPTEITIKPSVARSAVDAMRGDAEMVGRNVGLHMEPLLQPCDGFDLASGQAWLRAIGPDLTALDHVGDRRWMYAKQVSCLPVGDRVGREAWPDAMASASAAPLPSAPISCGTCTNIMRYMSVSAKLLRSLLRSAREPD